VVLEAIAGGTRKRVDWNWWEKFFQVIDREKLAKIKAMAEPALNDKPHERAVANAKAAAFKGRRPPGAAPEPPPLPATEAEWAAGRRKPAKSAKRKAAPVNTTRLLTPQAGPVNTTGPMKPKSVNTTKPRSADRHLEPNRDRHPSGYMRDYMRRWRTARKRETG
jgi:hypothetical protein